MPRWPKLNKKALGQLRNVQVLLPSDPPEYVFGLRAQDLFTPEVIRFWATCVSEIRGQHHPKVVAAFELADQIERDRRSSLVKVPD